MSAPRTAGLAPHSYLPHPARLTAIIAESADTRTFVVALDPPVTAFDDGRPGQFVMLSVLGCGEAAFTLSSLPGAGGAAGTVVVTVRRVGTLTSALFALAPGARVGVRGPFGRGFDETDAALPVVYIAGGCGLAPLRAAITREVGRARSAPLGIVYGTRDAASRIFTADLARWRDTAGVHVIECVEHPDRGWRGRRGSVVDCIEEAVRVVGAKHAVLCGPPVMLRLAARALLRAGLDPTAVEVALERYMKCGTGQCGHCYVNHRYVCTDGPVFSLAELLRLSEAFPGDAGSDSPVARGGGLLMLHRAAVLGEHLHLP